MIKAFKIKAEDLENNNMLKKSLLASTLIAVSSVSFAEAPGGPDCGWGNMMFEGDSGKVAHFGAWTFNNSSGNKWIGMLLGTNGCTTDGTITYGGKSLAVLNGVMDEIVEDTARGEGEALNAVAITLGVAKEDREDFNFLMNENFDSIFPHAEITAEEMLSTMQNLMKEDDTLKQYVS